MVKNLLVSTIKLNAVLWILSPWLFVALRFGGVIKTDHDWLVFLVLIAGSSLACFLNFNDN